MRRITAITALLTGRVVFLVGGVSLWGEEGRKEGIGYPLRMFAADATTRTSPPESCSLSQE